MAKESKDEEYLDNLLNSVIHEEQTGDMENQLEKESGDTEDITAENTNTDMKTDTNTAENISEELNNQSEADESADDTNDIDLNDIAGDEDEQLEDLMKLIDSFETADKDKKEDSIHKTEDITTNMDFKNPPEEHMQAEREKIIDEKTPDNHEGNSSSNKKKENFFKKIFTKKEKESSEDLNTLNADEILSETGSAFDDMHELALDDVGIEEKTNRLFADIENADDIPDIEAEADKKKKKQKEKKQKKRKEKKKRPPKQKKVRVKKEKGIAPVEYIHISPLVTAFAMSIIIVVVLALYFGSNIFAYNSNIDKATGYYVDKEYKKAYNVLAGMKLKGNDKDFYKQVENIMKVEKHIDDFYSYLELDMYVYALEALVKGIASFDENLDNAGNLGTYEILVEKSNEIDTLLKNYFNMSVEDARALNRLDSNAEFSKAVNEKAANINISSEEGTQGK